MVEPISLAKPKETNKQTAIIASSNAEIPVNVVTASFEHVSADYSSNGTFAPLQNMQLSSEIGGKVTRVLVKEGDFVHAGQTVATIKKMHWKLITLRLRLHIRMLL